MKIEIFRCNASNDDHVENMKDIINAFLEEEDAIVQSISTGFVDAPKDDDHDQSWPMMVVTVLYQQGPTAVTEQLSYRLKR